MLVSPSHTVPSAAAAQSAPTHRWIVLTLVAFVIVSLWDVAGQDLALAHWWGSTKGFALRSNHFLVMYMHEAMRMLGWVVVVALSIGVWTPLSCRD